MTQRLIGLTGSIGMGKSTTADMFRAENIPVFDADAEVHKLQASGGKALGPIEAAFPGVVQNGELDRQALGKHIFADDEARKKLEAIIHPMVGEARIAFFERHASAPFVILDIPLLFETGGNKAVHKVIVASAPAALQRERVLARPGMTEEKFEDIVKRQTPDAEKRAQADYSVDTSLGLENAKAQVLDIIQDLKAQYA